MIGLEASLRARRSGGAKLLIAYLMGGMDEDWPRLVEAVAAAGADAVELGIPFSDPMMDGPVIQEASLRALGRGTTPTTVIEGTAGIDAGIPLAVMTYANIVARAGYTRMAASLAAAGISGAIVPDLPLEEIGPWAAAADASGVETVMLVAPSTPPSRIPLLCARARGFVYAVARMGVTGERGDLGGEAAAVVDGVRRTSDLPVCVGIGISTVAQARAASSTADGVIVGSALVRRAMDTGIEAAAGFVAELRRGLDS